MTAKPTTTQTLAAVWLVGEITGIERASYCFEGRFRFELGAGWSLVLSPDDAGRFRLDACLAAHVRATMWVLAGDECRLASLALAASEEAAALAR